MQSRIENILNAMLNSVSSSTLPPPLSRNEALLLQLLDMINALVEGGGKLPIHICTNGEYDPVTGMPTIQNPEENIFYLVPYGTGNDVYTEWVYTNGAWEQFGSGTIEIPQSDWNQSDSTAGDYIKNKPDLSLKLDANQGAVNSGRLMAVNSSGGVVPAAAAGFDVVITETNISGDDYSITLDDDDSGGVVQVSGSTPSIVGVANTRYVCGTVSTISITPPASGTIDVIFTSGSSVAVLTLPNTVKMPEWWTGVETNHTYELLITDGVYGSVMAWAN